MSLFNSMNKNAFDTEKARETLSLWIERMRSRTLSKRGCMKHPKGIWGINPKTGDFYKHCSEGFKKHEECTPGALD